MDPKILEKGELKIVGCVSYGGDEGELWEVFEQHEKEIKHVNLNVWYELRIFPKNHEKNQKCHIMVGVEVKKFEGLPLETFAKTIPASTYAVFTHRLADGGYSGANDRMNKWLEESKYKLAFPLSIQYFDDRFKGSDHPESEIDFYLPITPK